MSETRENIPLTESTPHLKREVLSYKGVELIFNGVNHSPGTLKTYSKQLETDFAHSDVVLLEAAPRAQGLIDQEGRISNSAIEAYRRIYKIPPQEIRKRLEGSRQAIDFFAQVERWAGESGKDIIVFDPFTMDPQKVETIMRLRKSDEQLFALRMGLIALPGIAATGGMALVVNEAQKKHPRRTFLAGASATLAAGIAVSTGLGVHYENKQQETAASLDKSNPFTLTNINIDDYRNAAFVHAFTLLADHGMMDRKVTAVYGDAHRAQIRYYFEHPTQGALKLSTIYKSVLDEAPPHYNRFNHRGNNTWVKTQDKVVGK